jgi:hypothetical protein
MNCDEARDAYLELGRLSYAEEVDTKRIVVLSAESDRAKFRRALAELIERKAGSVDTRMKGAGDSERDGKFNCRVCTTSATTLRQT